MKLTHVALTIICITVVYGFIEITKAWIAGKQKEKESDERIELSKQETERLKICTAALKKTQVAAGLKSEHECMSPPVFSKER